MTKITLRKSHCKCAESAIKEAICIAANAAKQSRSRAIKTRPIEPGKNIESIVITSPKLNAVNEESMISREL